MAIDGYMFFVDYGGKFIKGESQVAESSFDKNDKLADEFKAALKENALFEINDYSFDIEQTLNIGSQSSGAGAGKVQFNPFHITRKIDVASPILYRMACAGVPFKKVVLGLRKSSGSNTSGMLYLIYTFKLVAIKSIGWAYDDESPKEMVSFEYGGLLTTYAQQNTDGSMKAAYTDGWNKVTNSQDQDPKAEIRAK